MILLKQNEHGLITIIAKILLLCCKFENSLIKVLIKAAKADIAGCILELRLQHLPSTRWFPYCWNLL